MAQASAEKLGQTRHAEKERVASVPKKSSRKGRQSSVVKSKRSRAICPDHQVVRWKRVQISKGRTLVRKRGIRAEHAEERVDFTKKAGKFQGGEKRQAKRAFLGEVRKSISG